MDLVQSFRLDNEIVTFIQMDKWLEKSKYLMRLCQENNVTIIKYYWRSIFDYEYIELFEPNIVDAFYMHVDIQGKEEDIIHVMEEYNKVKSMLESITVVEPFTEQEIEELACKCLKHMEIFS